MLRAKREELERALCGKVLQHHLYLLGELMDELEFVERKIARVETELRQRMKPHEEQVQRLCTIPGLDVLTAWTMLAELGPDTRHRSGELSAFLLTGTNLRRGTF